MSGIYIHIPFCKRRCYYCDFYSTTQVKQIPVLVEALNAELILRKNYLPPKPVETVYFGGGTPSLLKPGLIGEILKVISNNYSLSDDAEITLEANPDDLSNAYLNSLSKTPVNRLSIGIQSFDDTHLKRMNRLHNSQEAKQAIDRCKINGYNNLSIDLIYGLPNMDLPNWIEQLNQVIEFNVPHISAYHLTFEEGTVFEIQRKKNQLREIAEDISIEQFRFLINWAKQNGYEHYEISNFARNGQYSKHNTSYWQQKPYLGIGPAAHSYNLSSRSWNVSDLNRYIAGMQQGIPNFEMEILSEKDKLNDYIITALRTMWGVDLSYISSNFGQEQTTLLLNKSSNYLQQNKLFINDSCLKLTHEGVFISDQIMADLLYIDDK